MSIQKELRDSATSYRDTFKELQQISTQFAWGRAIIFILLLVVFLGFNVLLYSVVASILLAVVFGVLLKRDQSNEKKKILQKNLWELNEEEEKRVLGQFEVVHDGKKYTDPQHPYTQDLDIFGKDSLFASINRCYLRSSRDRLAEMLSTPVSLEVVRQRQEAIAELKGNREWRQSFQATLRSISNDKVDETALPKNLNSMPGGSLASILAICLGAITLGALVLVSFLPQYSAFAWAMIFINLLVILFFNMRLQKQALKTDYLQKFLVTFLSSLKLISDGSFDSAILRRLHAEVGTKALKEISLLRQIVFLLDSRGNLLWPLVNIVLLIDLHTFSMLQQWIAETSNISWTG